MTYTLAHRKAMTGIILSGGKSLRMGKDKAFIKVEGIPIIERITALFHKLFKETMIVTNHREAYLYLKVTLHEDLIPNAGALGGLYTGLFYSTFPYSFVVACDMPYLRSEVIHHLIEKIKGYDVVVPRTEDGLEPLHALYSKKCVEPIRSVLAEKKTRIIDLYPLVRVRVIEAKEILPVDPGMESFININTPEELIRFRKRNMTA